jgi:hypothetical protein
MSSSITFTAYNTINPPCYKCVPRKYKVAVPIAYVPLTANIGNFYSMPIPTYPNLQHPFQNERVWTPRPSYLNAIGNDPTHPLYFMSTESTR